MGVLCNCMIEKGFTLEKSGAEDRQIGNKGAKLSISGEIRMGGAVKKVSNCKLILHLFSECLDHSHFGHLFRISDLVLRIT